MEGLINNKKLNFYKNTPEGKVYAKGPVAGEFAFIIYARPFENINNLDYKNRMYLDDGRVVEKKITNFDYWAKIFANKLSNKIMKICLAEENLKEFPGVIQS